MVDVLNLPADTPAGDVWLKLWQAGIDVPHPHAGQSTTDWLETMPEEYIRKIYRKTQTALGGHLEND